MVKRLGLLILVLVLSVTGQSLRDETAMGAPVAPIAGPGIRPLDIVNSSVSRGLASVRSPWDFNTGEDSRAGIRRAADDLFDVGEIARRALGQHWKGLLPQEQHEFIRLFRDVLTRAFVTVVERYTDEHVASVDEKIAGTFAQVRSRITPARRPETTVEYRLSWSDSQWAVYDIVLDGMSLVSNYRSQLNSSIGTSSVALVLERMRTEPSRRFESPDAIAGASISESETPARARLAAGLLLGVAAHARWR